MSDYPHESDIPPGWERLTDGYVKDTDQVWIPGYQRFETPVSHTIGATVQSRFCTIRKVPLPPEGYKILTSGQIWKDDLKRDRGGIWEHINPINISAQVSVYHQVARKIEKGSNVPEGFVLVTEGKVQWNDRIQIGDGHWEYVREREVGRDVSLYHKIVRPKSPEKEPEVAIPEGWVKLKPGEIIMRGMRWRKQGCTTHPWTDVTESAWGDTLKATSSWDFIRRVVKKMEIPEKWEEVARGETVTDKMRWKNIGAPGLWERPCGSMGSKAWEFPDLFFIKPKEIAPTPAPVTPNKVVQKKPKPVSIPEPVKKEEKVEEKKMAVNPNTAKQGFFATMKESFAVQGKTAAFTTLAEKITDIVVGRLPKRLQLLCGVVPKPILVFVVSTTVYAVADRFEIPGKDHVRTVSKYAVDGSMMEAFRVFLKLLDPVFAAIREMAPRELAQLVSEVENGETPAKTPRKAKDVPAA